MATGINCDTNAKLVFSGWKDENGATINLTLLDALRVSLFDIDTATFLRKSENVLLSADLVLTSTGLMTWYLTPFDTQMIGDTEPGDSQTRTAYVRIAWGAERHDDLTNPFSTSAASRRIVVHHPNHGLAIKEPIFFEADTDVGGLDLGSQFSVDEVIDADHYAVYAHEPATSTAADAGGNVTAWVRGRAASANTSIAVIRNEPL